MTPRPTRHHGVGACYGVLTLLLGGLVVPTLAQDDDELAALEQQIAQQVKLIEQQLLAAGQQIESEQQALLDKLGRTHDALMAERQRNAALEAKIQALLGEEPAVDVAASTPEVSPDAAPETVGWVQLPAREVGPLGLIKPAERTLAPLPAGTDELVVLFPEGLNLPRGVVLPQGLSRGETTDLVYPAALGADRPVATLLMRDGGLVWRWHALSPTDLGDAMRFLDVALRLSIIEARRAGVTLRQYQLAPFKLSVPPGEGVRNLSLPVPLGAGPYRLEIEAVPSRWSVLSDQPDQVELVALSRFVSLRWNEATSTVAVGYGPGLNGRLETLRREREGWERDLDAAATGQADASAMDLPRIQSRIAELRDAEARLGASLATLSTVPPTPLNVTAGVDSAVVRLVAAQRGVVVYRLEVE